MDDLKFIFPAALIILIFFLTYKNLLSLDLTLLIVFFISIIFLLANSKNFVLNSANFFDIKYPPLIVIIIILYLLLLNSILILVMFTEYRNRQNLLLIKISEIELLQHRNIHAVNRDSAGAQTIPKKIGHSELAP